MSDESASAGQQPEQEKQEEEQQEQRQDSSVQQSSAPELDAQVDYQSLLDAKPTYSPQLSSRANRPERLALCVDASTEFAVKVFRMRNGDTVSLLDLTVKCFHLLAMNKLRLGEGRHELSLLGMRGNRLSVLQPFTSDAGKMAKALTSQELRDLLQQPAGDEAAFSLDCLLDYAAGQQPQSPEAPLLRIVLLCCRSQTPPRLSERLLRPLLADPSLFVDILYVHEPPAADNRVEEIFKRLCCLESEHSRSYIHEVLNNPTAFFNQAATFLAHPMQRPTQPTASYRLQRPASAVAAVSLAPLVLNQPTETTD